MKNSLPPPGDGLFKYNEVKVHDNASAKSRRTTLNGTNRFMGFPIRTSQENTDTSGVNRQPDFDITASRVL